MTRLKRCPECYSEMEVSENGIEYCNVCDYWTVEGTARLDSITMLA
ncbi:hypothetical protein [Methanohalophilus sp. RSK]|nr:hypothetical protein [Methanohalophilus sp. RSK]